MAKDTETAAPAPKGETATPKTRSPNYPVYRLATAVEKTKILYDAFKRHSMPITAVAAKLGFKLASSSFAQALAAIKAYGLVDVQGSGDSRKIAVTEEGAKIVANHPDRPALLRAAAVLPKLHLELYKQFFGPDGLAPDEMIKHYLVWERPEGKFNDESVEPFLRQFRATLSFGGVTPRQAGDEDTEKDMFSPSFQVGDYVQWTSQGIQQFPTARRITSISEDGKFALVDNETTGLPVEQLEKVPAPAGVTPPAAPGSNPGTPTSKPGGQSPNHLAAEPGTKQEMFALHRGAIVVQWPENIEESDVEDVEAWIPILLRKIKKSAKPAEPTVSG